MARSTHTIPGKVVAITGAGRGIGRALRPWTAKRFRDMLAAPVVEHFEVTRPEPARPYEVLA